METWALPLVLVAGFYFVTAELRRIHEQLDLWLRYLAERKEKEVLR